MRLRNALGVAATIALAGFSVTGCGSGSSSSSIARHALTTTPRTRSTRSTPPRKPPLLPAGKWIGATQPVRTSGTTLSVTVSRVIDPLLGSRAALLAGDRAVGVLVRIDNDGPGIYDSSATGDISILPSSGTATPVYALRGICQTPLRDFDNYITEGEVRTVRGIRARQQRQAPCGPLLAPQPAGWACHLARRTGLNARSRRLVRIEALRVRLQAYVASVDAPAAAGRRSLFATPMRSAACAVAAATAGSELKTLGMMYSGSSSDSSTTEAIA